MRGAVKGKALVAVIIGPANLSFVILIARENIKPFLKLGLTPIATKVVSLLMIGRLLIPIMSRLILNLIREGLLKAVI